MRTQVGIIGAGPAGLLLSHMLALEGIEFVVIEGRSRSYVEGRVRAGVLEQGTIDILDDTGVGGRMRREGLAHHGLEMRFRDEGHRIDLTGLTGRSVMVYAQQEVVKDLIAARLAAGGTILFEAVARRVEDHRGTQPRIVFEHEGRERVLDCDFVAGCDGFHGVARAAIPDVDMTVFEREYPFAWLGILSQSPPPADELIYCHHERGFALYSMRSPSVSRLYVQCPPDTAADAWSDERVWDELERRLGSAGPELLKRGAVTQKGVAPMRSFVTEPMQQGRLFLAGDAAHIVPPAGAKGLNLAVADVRILARAMEAYYRSGDTSRLDRYSQAALRRVWRAQHFSWWMTTTFHRTPGATSFDIELQLSQLDFLARSTAAAAAFAENYTGLPFED